MARIRVGVAGCGNVSEHYLADLKRSPQVEVVSVCDVIEQRARRRAQEFDVGHWFDDVDAMLEGEEFGLLINLTSMQSHFAVNLAGLRAGRHVLSEKPMATRPEEGRILLETARGRGVKLLAAPNVVTSPAFRCMAEATASGEIGQVCAVRGRYGHGGPSWGPWFYKKGGGSLFDLGVYNITFLTGLLGPAIGVTAMMGTAVGERVVEGERVEVEADDNAMVLMDFGQSRFACVATGFVYGGYRDERTIEIIGTRGCVNLLGFDWEPKGVEVWTAKKNEWEVRCRDQEGYAWQRGGTYVAECLATGREPMMTGEHAYHVLEVMAGAMDSSETGRKVEVKSGFGWPVVRAGKRRKAAE